MTTGELLEIKPQELQFPFELKKQISCSMQLINKSKKYVAFKVKSNNPKNYCVRPCIGVVLPRSTADVIVTMQAQKEAPSDMQCHDKFLVQSVVINEGTSTKDLPPSLFNKEEGHDVDECKLEAAYVALPQPPSLVWEGSDDGTVNAFEFTTKPIKQRDWTATKMNTRELLQIEPHELQFPFELKKQISISMQLINRSKKYVAFKVKTTIPKKYSVQPNTGVVLPRSTAHVIVTMQGQREAPPDMQCMDKFLVQCVVINEGTSAKDFPPNLFKKEDGHDVKECKLKVAYVALPQPVRKGSEDGAVNASELTTPLLEETNRHIGEETNRLIIYNQSFPPQPSVMRRISKSISHAYLWLPHKTHID